MLEEEGKQKNKRKKKKKIEVLQDDQYVLNKEGWSDIQAQPVAQPVPVQSEIRDDNDKGVNQVRSTDTILHQPRYCKDKKRYLVSLGEGVNNFWKVRSDEYKV